MASGPASSTNVGSTNMDEVEKAPAATVTASPSSPRGRSITGFKWLLVVAGILSSTFLFALDNSIVADVQPKIIDTFGDIDKLPWLSVAFALGSAASALIWASAYTKFDAKCAYMLGVFLFEVGSAICGAANLMDVLILGRALAGLGGVGMYVGVLTLLSAVTTPGERPVYLASVGITWGLGSVLGPVIGGAFGDSSATWRWSFYINLVVAALFAPVYVFILPNYNPQPLKSTREKYAELDYLGAFIFLCMMCFGIAGISFGGSLFPWGSAATIVLIVLGVVFFGIFIAQQALCLGTTHANRLFPAQYFRRRTHALLWFLTALTAASLFVPVYFIPLFAQFTRGASALDAAVRLLPFLFMLVLFSLVQGAVMSKEGHYVPWYLFAAAVTLSGSALMATVDENTPDARLYGYSAFLAMGAGTVVQTGFVVAQATTPRAEMPSSVAFINVAQIAGMALSLTTANTLFLNLAQRYLTAALPGAGAEAIQSAVSGTGSAFLRGLPPDAQRAALHAVVRAIGRVYIYLAAGGAVSLLLSLGLRWERVFLKM